jgi:hypothetical protein
MSFRFASCGLTWLFVTSLACMGQSTTSSQPTSPSTAEYVGFSYLPAPAQQYLFALGSRIQKAGNERTTLTGTFTDSSGNATNAQLIWQVPGQISFSLTGQSGPPLGYSTSGGLMNAATMTSANADILESLFDDTAESFLYGFLRGDGHRLIGLSYRGDNGTTPNYTGPWYDVYVRSAGALAQPGAPVRSKFYFFNSQTKLLAKVTYQLPGALEVETDINGWTTTNGQSFPGQIIRKENGNVVFTFNIAQATGGPAPNDGLFGGQ